MNNILILCAGRRVSLVRGFMDAVIQLDLSNTNIYTADMNPHLSAACQVSDKYFQLPAVRDDNYAAELLDLCKRENIVLVVPTIDTELEVLASLRDSFLSQKINLLVSNSEFINHCTDKRKTAELFKSIDLNTPRIYKPDDIQYPVLVKPFDGSLSIGVHLLKNAGNMTNDILKNPKNIFCEYIDHDYHDEYTVDMYFDSHSQLKCVVPRRRMEVRGGEVSKALAEKNEIITVLFRQMGKVHGARGCITLQLFRHRETHAHFYNEINARFGGGYPLSRLAGADFQRWIIQEYLLNQDIPEFHDWSANTLMMRYDAEILAFDYSTQ